MLPLVAASCVECHDGITAAGGLDLERFGSLESTLADRTTWKRVHEFAESGQMPPPDGSRPLSNEEREALLANVLRLQALPDPRLGAVDPGKPTLRRLTRLEYNDTVRDLFGLSIDVFMFPERQPLADKAYFRPETGTMGDRVEVSRREYGQKYRVLLPRAGLPGDNRAEFGFANRGDALNVSPLSIEKYLTLGEAIVESPELPKLSPIFAELIGLDAEQVSAAKQAQRSASPSGKLESAEAVARVAPDANGLREIDGAATSLASFRDSIARAFAEGRGGTYDVPKSHANKTLPGKGASLSVLFAGGTRRLSVNPNADLWLVSFATADATSGDLIVANKNKGEKRYELTFGLEGVEGDDGLAENLDGRGVTECGLCVLARRGQEGTIRIVANLDDRSQQVQEVEVDGDAGRGTVFVSFVAPKGAAIRRLDVDGAAFSGDYVLIDDLAFVTDAKPREGQANSPLAGPEANETTPDDAAPRENAAATPKLPPRERLAAFLNRAFRRPAAKSEVDLYFGLFESARASGKGEADAMRRAVAAALASPSFLFVAEEERPDGPSVRPLDDYELASRLSYFLWSSMPDDELFALAEAGKLQDEATLEAQTRRMLRDPRVRELSESFAVQWLRLDQLYSSKPDRKLFSRFYEGPQGKSTLHGAALVEPMLLYETTLVENRSVVDLIDPGYGWLNGELISLYGLEEAFREDLVSIAKGGDEANGPVDPNREVQLDAKGAQRVWFRRELPDRTRGGVMTMAGPLVVTSLPYRTSPVKRGAWILETILNRPPAEPKVAFVLEDEAEVAPEDRTMTVRERFEAHRTQAECRTCHIRIDPPGFALEAFDPVGALRTHDGTTPVDTTGEWNGIAFDGPVGFKDALLADREAFVRGFVERLLEYALARKLDGPDMPVVERILERTRPNDYRLQDVIAEVVLSYPFRNVRNQELASR